MATEPNTFKQNQLKSSSETNSVLQSHDLNGIVQFIKSNQCQKIIILTGAGISVEAGIPDYRSKNGFYNTVNINEFTSLTNDEKQWLSEDIENRILSAELFKFAPSVYLQCQGELFVDLIDEKCNKYKPTLSHWFIKLLDNKNLLKRYYTTNIDGLSLKTGLDVQNDKVVPIHGTLAYIKCFACKKVLTDQDEIDEFVHKIKTKKYLKETIKCKYCIGNNLGPPHMKPSVVLFGEPIPFKFFDLIHNKKDLSDIDLLIIIGTTLKVYPSNLLPVICRETNKKCIRLLINKDNVNEFDEMFDFKDKNSNDVFLQGKCDDIIMELAKLLHWDKELEVLMTDKSHIQCDNDEQKKDPDI
eukprot:160500_1